MSTTTVPDIPDRPPTITSGRAELPGGVPILWSVVSDAQDDYVSFLLGRLGGVTAGVVSNGRAGTAAALRALARDIEAAPPWTAEAADLALDDDPPDGPRGPQGVGA